MSETKPAFKAQPAREYYIGGIRSKISTQAEDDAEYIRMFVRTVFAMKFQNVVSGCGRLAKVADRMEATAREFQERDALLFDVAACGVEHDDQRLDYVNVQMPRLLWDEIRSAVDGETQ